MAAEVVALPPAPGSPQWYLEKLYRELMDRRPELEHYNDYYTGDHPLPWLAPQARDEFRRILKMTRTNVLGMVADAKAERIRVEGFRFGKDSGADDRSWDIWQGNNMDSDSDIAWLEALIGGTSYFHVAANPDDPALPHIWVEHASQMIVAYESGSNRRNRKAGLKVWRDDWEGEFHATMQVKTGNVVRLYKYRAEAPRYGGLDYKPRWLPRQVDGESWGMVIPNMPKVSMIEIPNNPRLLTGGRSELYDLIPIQDRINKTVADRLITQDYGAFPQKWISAWPEEDADGNPTPPIEIGRNRAITTEIAETRFGQWETAPLDPYSFAKREDIKDIASRSRTPAQYLLGDMSNVNGETLKASESGHIAVVKQRCRPYGESAEETMRLARVLAGLTGPDDARMETVFSNPEFRTEGELTDAVMKKQAGGLISNRQALMDIGYTLTQIKQIEADLQREGIDPMVQRALREPRIGQEPQDGAAVPPVRN